jgi:hypothetical protein
MQTKSVSRALSATFFAAAALAAAAFLPRAACAAEPEFLVRIHGHKFVPAEVKIPAGVKVRLVIENQDDSPEEFDSHPLNREKHIPAKSKVTLFLGPLDPGRYAFEGETRGDPGATAQGILVVQ